MAGYMGNEWHPGVNGHHGYVQQVSSFLAGGNNFRPGEVEQNDFFGDGPENVQPIFASQPSFAPQTGLPQFNQPAPVRNISDFPDMRSSRSSEEMSNQEDEYNDGAQLAINGIPETMNKHGFYTLLSKYGKIQNLKMKKDHRYQGQNFAYATYRSRPEALIALTAIREADFGNAEGFNIAGKVQARLYDPRHSGRSRPNQVQSFQPTHQPQPTHNHSPQVHSPQPHLPPAFKTNYESKFAIDCNIQQPQRSPQFEQVRIIGDCCSTLPRFTAIRTPIELDISMNSVDRTNLSHARLAENGVCLHVTWDEAKNINYAIVIIVKTDKSPIGFSDVLDLGTGQIIHNIFNGLLFEAPKEKVPEVMSCTLAHVTLTTEPKMAFNMLQGFLTGRPGQPLHCHLQIIKSDENTKHVKIYKNVNENDFAMSLKAFNFCTLEEPVVPILHPVSTLHPVSVPPPALPAVVYSTPPPSTVSSFKPSSNSGNFQNGPKLAHSIFQPRFKAPCCAIISHISFWPVFFIQVVSDPLRRLSGVEKILMERKDTMRINPILKSGSLVVASFKNDLYRGIVTDVQGDQYDIFYMDWGNTGSTSIASVDRPVEFWDIPAMAVPCVLENFEKYNKMGENISDLLNYLLVSKTVLNDVEFTSGPAGKITLRDYIRHIHSSDLKNYCYSVRIPDIEELIENEKN